MAKTIDLGGLYTHDVLTGTSAGSAFASTSELEQGGVEWLETRRWTVDFQLDRDKANPTIASLDAKISALEVVLRNIFGYVHLVNEDGSISPHQMDGARLLGGVRCIQPPNYTRYQDGSGGFYRDGQYVLEGVFARYYMANVVNRLDNNLPRIFTVARSSCLKP